MGATPPSNIEQNSNTATAVLGKLVGLFGPTDAILIMIAGALISVVMGWVSSPMLKTMQDIREEQVARRAIVDKFGERTKRELELLQKICVHDSVNDQEKADCWR